MQGLLLRGMSESYDFEEAVNFIFNATPGTVKCIYFVLLENKKKKCNILCIYPHIFSIFFLFK